MIKFVKFLIIALLVTVCIQESQAQKNYSFGSRTAVTLTSTTAIALTPVTTLTVYQLEADTNITFTISSSAKSIIGDMLILRIKALTSNRVMTFSGSIVGTADTITSAKTKTFIFMYTGSKYEQLSEVQID